MEDKNTLCKMQQQLFCSEIVKRAPSILESGEWADCIFMVGAKPHQVIVGGYKLVLALASPVFEAMFYGSLAETKDQIPIVDVEPEIFKAMLQYMYTDIINISSWSEACQLYYAAKKYMMQQLMELCSEYLQTNLKIENVCQIYEHSLLFEDDALTQKCIKMFSDNTSNLLKDNSFTAAQLNTIITIFSLETLNLDSELDLIEAAARYAKAQDIKNKEEKSVSSVSFTSMNEIDKQMTCGPSDLLFGNAEKKLIQSAVRNIRFLTLTPQQYANCATRYAVLTPTEDYALLINIASDKSDVPMPSGFSTSKIDRVGTSFYSRIDGYLGNNTVTSQAHIFRKLKWQIRLRPHTQYRSNDSVCFSLLCTNEIQSSNWLCDASAEIRIISHKPDVKPLIFNFQHVFSKQQSEKRNTQQMTMYDSIKKNYMKNASIEMEVVIKVNNRVGI